MNALDLTVPSTSDLLRRSGTNQPHYDETALTNLANALMHGDAETKAVAAVLAQLLLQDTVSRELDRHVTHFMGHVSQAVRSFEEAFE